MAKKIGSGGETQATGVVANLIPAAAIPDIEEDSFIWADDRQSPFATQAAAEAEFASRKLDMSKWQVVPFAPGFTIVKVTLRSGDPMAAAAAAVARQTPDEKVSAVPVGQGNRIMKIVIARGGEDEPKVVTLGHNGDEIHVQRGVPVLIRERFWNSAKDAVKPRFAAGIMQPHQKSPLIDGYSESVSASFLGFATEADYDALRKAGLNINRRERMSRALQAAQQQSFGGGPAPVVAYCRKSSHAHHRHGFGCARATSPAALRSRPLRTSQCLPGFLPADARMARGH
jgi:hypothetical protein